MAGPISRMQSQASDSRIERQVSWWRKWWWGRSALLFQRPRNSSSSCGTHNLSQSRLFPMISVFVALFLLTPNTGVFFVRRTQILHKSHMVYFTHFVYCCLKINLVLVWQMKLAEWHIRVQNWLNGIYAYTYQTGWMAYSRFFERADEKGPSRFFDMAGDP